MSRGPKTTGPQDVDVEPGGGAPGGAGPEAPLSLSGSSPDGSGGASGAGSAAAVTAVAGGSTVQASLLSDAWRQLRRSKVFVGAALILAVLTVMAVFPKLFTRVDPRQCDLSRSKGTPSGEAWFGYDLQGCDYFSNVVHGARVSIQIGLLVVGASLVVGVVLGAVAGYYGGWFDTLIARITDVAYGIPTILGSILILNAFTDRTVWTVSLALVALGWMTILRLLRSSVISIKESDYVAAARALGANDRRIIMTHILPNALAPVFVYSTIAVGTIIAAEATLSFLGIGLQLPAISWGLQISQGQSLLRTAPHLLLFPSLFLSVTVLCFILLGDALRDALDPKLR